MSRNTKKPSQKSAHTFSKKAIQDRLDVAAEYLEREGHHDLAAKIDYYCARLDGCSPDEVPLIKRALARIIEDGRSRIPTQTPPQNTERVAKARAATQRARRSAENKKAAIKRRLKEIATRRKKAKDMLESFRASRKERLRKRAEDLRRNMRK